MMPLLGELRGYSGSTTCIHRHRDIGSRQAEPASSGRGKRADKSAPDPVLGLACGQDRAHHSNRPASPGGLCQARRRSARTVGIRLPTALGIGAQPVPVDAVGPAEPAGRRGETRRSPAFSASTTGACSASWAPAAPGGPVDATGLQERANSSSSRCSAGLRSPTMVRTRARADLADCWQ